MGARTGAAAHDCSRVATASLVRRFEGLQTCVYRERRSKVGEVPGQEGQFEQKRLKRIFLSAAENASMCAQNGPEQAGTDGITALTGRNLAVPGRFIRHIHGHSWPEGVNGAGVRGVLWGILPVPARYRFPVFSAVSAMFGRPLPCPSQFVGRVPVLLRSAPLGSHFGRH